MPSLHFELLVSQCSPWTSPPPPFPYLQDLKDVFRKAGDVVFTDVNREAGEGVVEFSTREVGTGGWGR